MNEHIQKEKPSFQLNDNSEQLKKEYEKIKSKSVQKDPKWKKVRLRVQLRCGCGDLDVEVERIVPYTSAIPDGTIIDIYEVLPEDDFIGKWVD